MIKKILLPAILFAFLIVSTSSAAPNELVTIGADTARTSPVSASTVLVGAGAVALVGVAIWQLTKNKEPEPSSLLRTAYAVSGGGAVIRSRDGIVWSQIATMPVSSILEGLVYNGNQWIAVGIDSTSTNVGAIFTSTDTINWTQQSVPTTPTSVSDLYDAAWDGSKWVVVGSGDAFTKGVILTSNSAGTAWTQQTVPDHVKFLQGIAWNGSLFVASGWDDVDSSTVILTSPDGVTWTRQTVPSNIKLQSDVVWNGSLWVSAGRDMTYSNAAIITSPDGITWTEQSTGIGTETYWFYGLAWNGREWIAVGEGDASLSEPKGQIYTSPDAITWTKRNIPSGSSANVFFSAKWNGERWIVVGSEAEIPKLYGYIFTSSDGVNWTQRSVPAGTRGLTEVAVD